MPSDPAPNQTPPSAGKPRRRPTPPRGGGNWIWLVVLLLGAMVIWASMRDGWNYVRERPSLMAMIVFYMAMAFNIYAITVLLTPMVLGFTDARGLGFVASTTGCGMIIGAVIAMSLTSLQRKMHGVLGASMVISLGIITLSICPLR